MSEEFSVSIDTVAVPAAALVATAGGFALAASAVGEGLMLSAAAGAELARVAARHGVEITAAARARMDAVANDARLALVRGALGTAGMAAIEAGRAALPDGTAVETAPQALVQAERALDTAFARLRAAEPVAVMSAVRGALTDCGFTVAAATPVRGARKRVTGRKAGRTVMLELDRHGCTLQGDVGGFSGQSCRTELQALNKALVARGLHLGVRVARLHGDPRGGVMLRAAERGDDNRAVQAPLLPARGR